ncbi:4'-phosphopantetheinyl transferase superfamily protein [Sorangium sp. So ce119]|uniref:4'-phosphopantetheinyl transferase family protein n=1 Tax=Sorangium sp. So ce119 TaxID=3133279 RepID=UPI003F5EBE23
MSGPMDTVRVESCSYGVVAVVAIPGREEAAAVSSSLLSPAERAHLARLGARVRGEFVAGRVAMRVAARAFGVEPADILPDDRGAPTLPSPLTGSIAHNAQVAVALVGRADEGTLGIDVEAVERFRPAIEELVLTAPERADVDAEGAPARSRAVLLRFSAKEALYKALDRHVRRYVGFQEARVRSVCEGSSASRGLLGAELRIELDLEDGEGPFAVEGRYGWEPFGLLTSARVSRRV